MKAGVHHSVVYMILVLVLSKKGRCMFNLVSSCIMGKTAVKYRITSSKIYCAGEFIARLDLYYVSFRAARGTIDAETSGVRRPDPWPGRNL